MLCALASPVHGPSILPKRHASPLNTRYATQSTPRPVCKRKRRKQKVQARNQTTRLGVMVHPMSLFISFRSESSKRELRLRNRFIRCFCDRLFLKIYHSYRQRAKSSFALSNILLHVMRDVLCKTPALSIRRQSLSATENGKSILHGIKERNHLVQQAL